MAGWRDYYYRHHERILAEQRERNERRRDDPARREAERAYNREQRERTRWNRRRIALGLPVARRHRSTLNERVAHEAEAAAFFSARVSTRRMRQLLAEGRDVEWAVRWANAGQERTELHRLERFEAALDVTTRLAGLVRAFLEGEHGRQILEEVRMDSIARTLRGKDPYDVRREAVRRAFVGNAVWWHSDTLRDTSRSLDDTWCHPSAPFCPIASGHARGDTVAKSVSGQIRPHL